MVSNVETSRELDGGWVATVNAVPGLVVYGNTEEETRAAAARLTAILVPENEKRATAILGFYPGEIPASAFFTEEPLLPAA